AAVADERARTDGGPCRMRRAHELAFYGEERLELCHAIAFELGGRPVVEGVHHYHIAEIGPERLQPRLQRTKCRPHRRLEGFRGTWRARLLPYHDTRHVNVVAGTPRRCEVPLVVELLLARTGDCDRPSGRGNTGRHDGVGHGGTGSGEQQDKGARAV